MEKERIYQKVVVDIPESSKKSIPDFAVLECRKLETRYPYRQFLPRYDIIKDTTLVFYWF